MTQTVLCLASNFKGGAFLQTCKEAGMHVILITVEKTKGEAWPRESIDEYFDMPNLGKRSDITHAVAYLARSRQIDLIVALDDFDVDIAAHLREHFRLPGMGDSLARNFRDKLAMRTTARHAGLLVPEFTGVFNYDLLRGSWLACHHRGCSSRAPKPVRWALKDKPLRRVMADSGITGRPGFVFCDGAVCARRCISCGWVGG